MYEQEIKLTAADNAVLERVLQSKLVRGLDTGVGGEDATRYVGVYYDTDDNALETAGYSLRARREGTRCRAALKFGGSIEDGLSRRHELLADITGWLDHTGQLPDGELNDKMRTLVPEDTPLRARVTVDMQRSIRNLNFHGAEIELAADSGVIKGQRRQVALHEIELELKRGDLAKVIRLGSMLAQQFPLTPSAITKHGIGLQLGLG